MSHRTVLVAILAAILYGAATHQVSAELISIAYRGTVVSEQISAGNTSPVPIGTTIEGVLTYDITTAGVVNSPNQSRYQNALVAHQVTILGQVFSLDGLGDVFINNDVPTNGFDNFLTGNARFQQAPTLSGLSLTGLNFAFNDTSGSAFDSTALPTSFSLESFDVISAIATLELAGGPAIPQVTSYTIDFTEAVPEPSAALLLLIANLTTISSRSSRA